MSVRRRRSSGSGEDGAGPLRHRDAALTRSRVLFLSGDRLVTHLRFTGTARSSLVPPRLLLRCAIFWP